MEEDWKLEKQLGLEGEKHFGGGGLFSYLSRRFHGNPHITGQVRVRVSLPTHAWTTPSSLVDGDFKGYSGCVHSENHLNAWCQVDLGAFKRLVPSKFALRTRGGTEPINYELQGSLDAQKWVVLSKQEGDRSLVGGQPCAFEIDYPAVIEENKALFRKEKNKGALRYFRILQTGSNSANNHYLIINQMELFGDFYSLKDTKLEEKENNNNNNSKRDEHQ